MTIVYFDSSALVKLVVEEAGSDTSAALWDGADAVMSSGLAYPEVRAALGAARRGGRISRRSLARAKTSWERFWDALAIVQSNRGVLMAAGDIAERQSLRGYDAVHLASALTVGGEQLVMAVWDVRLRDAAMASGLSIAPLRL